MNVQWPNCKTTKNLKIAYECCIKHFLAVTPDLNHPQILLCPQWWCEFGPATFPALQQSQNLYCLIHVSWFKPAGHWGMMYPESVCRGNRRCRLSLTILDSYTVIWSRSGRSTMEPSCTTSSPSKYACLYIVCSQYTLLAVGSGLKHEPFNFVFHKCKMLW